MEEVWLKIEGYCGKYEVSNMGNVRSLKGKTKLLQQRTLNSGYLYVSLTSNCKSNNKTVHRLVTEAFIPNPEGKGFVNHIDGNKTNNCANNLEWVTKSENMKHAYKNGLFKNFIMPKPRKKKVIQIDKDGTIIRIFSSLTEAAKETGTGISKISLCCSGKRKTTNGYSWEYQKEG